MIVQWRRSPLMALDTPSPAPGGAAPRTILGEMPSKDASPSALDEPGIPDGEAAIPSAPATQFDAAVRRLSDERVPDPQAAVARFNSAF